MQSPRLRQPGLRLLQPAAQAEAIARVGRSSLTREWHRPRAGQRRPRAGQRLPRAGLRVPRAGQRPPRTGRRFPRAGGCRSRAGGRGSRGEGLVQERGGTGTGKSLLAEVAHRTEGGSLPGFVIAEFERYLACGVLAHGFTRVRCDACGKVRLVALSCKGRGFCPACDAGLCTASSSLTSPGGLLLLHVRCDSHPFDVTPRQDCWLRSTDTL